MVQITVIKNESGNIIGLDAKGHTGEIVCAGVSTLLHTVYLSLMESGGCAVIAEASSGSMSFMLADKPTPLTDQIFGVGFVGLREIAAIYPDSVAMIDVTGGQCMGGGCAV